MTDRDLLSAYAATGDTESLGEFLGRYQGRLVRFVSRLIQDEGAAQDVVQETFLRVARHPRRLLDVSSCHNWLLRVARNLSVDHVRGAARRRRHTEELARRRSDPAAAPGGALAAPADAPAELSEVRQRVRDEIHKLSPRMRELMLLKVQEEKSYREIAEITGLSITNVGYILHQAMKILARRLEDMREARS